MVNEDGPLGEANDVRCVSIEKKLGIKGSPTAVLSYGDNGGAIGYLVGEENRGLEIMFGMMNHARFSVGLQGLSISERACNKRFPMLLIVNKAHRLIVTLVTRSSIILTYCAPSPP